jgi:hypothetical protein
MVRKLAIRSLRRGIGSMDYIDILLIMEDDLDDEVESLGEFGQSSHSENPFNPDEPSEPTEQSTPTIPNPSQVLLADRCQIGANVENADQCFKKLRTNAVSRKNASPKLLGLPNYVLIQMC